MSNITANMEPTYIHSHPFTSIHANIRANTHTHTHTHTHTDTYTHTHTHTRAHTACARIHTFRVQQQKQIQHTVKHRTQQTQELSTVFQTRNPPGNAGRAAVYDVNMYVSMYHGTHQRDATE